MPKKVVLTLARLDGNAFNLMGVFQRRAKEQGWPSEEIAKVLAECQNGDYDHLLQTLIENTVPPDDEEPEDGVCRTCYRKFEEAECAN